MDGPKEVTDTSYAEVVKGKNKGKIWQQKGVRTTNEWRGFDFKVKEEEMDWLNKCFVGNVHNPYAVYLL